jgi:NtrC-family two-component system response regulator AlgB
LVVDDEENIRVTLAMCLEADGHTAVTCAGIEEALEQISRQVFDLVFLDLRLGVHNGLDYIAGLLSDYPWTKIVVITAYASVATAVKAMKLGATDYLPKPFTPAQVQLVTQKVAERRRLELKIDALQTALGAMDPEANLPTENAQMRKAIELARQVAPSNSTVLLCGEIGTGKGRLARAIHAWSPRAHAPFAAVSCDTTSADELDAELFGLTRRDVSPPVDVPGRVELCRGGTLVLHDVAQTPPSLQPKLLRLLADKEFERHEDFKPRGADVRIIGATSQDPDEAVKRRRLRQELLLMLDVVRIDLPPLRNRPEDIRMLARRYLAYFSRENHRAIGGFTTEASNALRKYPWPGNTRELRNLIERAVILCQSDEIGVEHFPPNLLSGATSYGIGDLVPLDTIEDLHIRRVLDSTGSIKGAAAVLGIGVSTMVRWMKRVKVSPPPADLAALAAGAANEKPAG